MDKGTVYLDNASTTWPKPPDVARAMSRFLAEGAASPGRGGYAMAGRNADLMARLRRLLAAMLNAESPDRVILTPGATDSFNMAILGLFAWPERPPSPPPRVVTTVLEHNAIRRPLAFLATRGLVEVREVGCDARGRIDAAEMLAAVDDRTVLVSVMSASNVTGVMLPWRDVCRGLRRTRPDVLTLVDASQTMGLDPLDVRADGVDLVAFPGHKALMGPTGTGVLYVSPRATGEAPGARVRMEPTRFGGTGGDSGADLMPASLPRRFEPGSANTVGFVGLLAALESADRRPGPETLAHERGLLSRVFGAFAGRPGVGVLGPETVDDRVGTAALVFDGWSPTDLGAALDSQHGIAVRCGLHCAPGTHRALGTFDRGGAVRISPGPYNTAGDVDLFIGAVNGLLAAAPV